MRVELPSGNWIEVREEIKGGDIFAVHEASEVPLDQDGRPARMSFQKLEDDQLIALFHRVVTGWSFQVPLPGSPAAAKSVLSDLQAGDLKKLKAELKPLLDEVKNDDLPDPKPPATS